MGSIPITRWMDVAGLVIYDVGSEPVQKEGAGAGTPPWPLPQRSEVDGHTSTTCNL